MIKCLDRLKNKLGCKLHGHGPFFVLHVYETKVVKRFFRCNTSWGIRVTDKPVDIKYEFQKRVCKCCGRVSVDLMISDQSEEQESWQ